MTGVPVFVTTIIGAQVSAYNAASGTFAPNGAINYSGTLIGIGQTAQGVVELAGSTSRLLGPTGMALGLVGAIDNYQNIQNASNAGDPIQESDIAGVVGNIAATIGSAAIVVGASGPIIVGLAVVGVGAGVYQIVASAKGWQINSQNKQLEGVELSDSVRVSIQDSIADQIADVSRPVIAGLGPICRPEMSNAINTAFHAARAWSAPVDPLMLDLDGDGLELKSASGSILFDHDADGIRTGTGWIGSDDGILVRDLNGNGAIDSGRELFGVDTLKSNGQKAVNGFDALRDLDSNADGNFTAADAAWRSVKVWRDLDQDGVSDAGELFTLEQLGISRIGVVGAATGGQAGTTINGNFVAQSATFTKDGQTKTVGAVDLENNTFYREFTDTIELTAQAKALPRMQGSGRARDLSEASSLSPALAAVVGAFAAGTTRGTQRANLGYVPCGSGHSSH